VRAVPGNTFTGSGKEVSTTAVEKTKAASECLEAARHQT
jgi:hypothetical protein